LIIFFSFKNNLIYILYIFPRAFSNEKIEEILILRVLENLEILFLKEQKELHFAEMNI